MASTPSIRECGAFPSQDSEDDTSSVDLAFIPRKEMWNVPTTSAIVGRNQEVGGNPDPVEAKDLV